MIWYRRGVNFYSIWAGKKTIPQMLEVIKEFKTPIGTSENDLRHAKVSYLSMMFCLLKNNGKL